MGTMQHVMRSHIVNLQLTLSRRFPERVARIDWEYDQHNVETRVIVRFKNGHVATARTAEMYGDAFFALCGMLYDLPAKMEYDLPAKREK